MKMNLSELGNHLTRRLHKQRYSAHNSGWDIDTREAPFDYIFVHLSENEAVSKVTSIDYIARRFVKGGGNIIRPKLKIPGIGTMITCEDIAGHRFSFIEEELSQGVLKV